MSYLHQLITIGIFVFSLLVVIDGFPQKDNLKKNKKLSKAENERYEKDLREHPNSAEPHWRHAKIIGTFNSNEAKEAWRYYDQALKIDSTNAAIWADFADYLLKVFDDKKVALNLYQRAQALEPENKKYKDRVEELTKNIEQIQETIRLRSLGYSDRRKINHDISYNVISNLDSLQAITELPESPYNYAKLLKRFMEDDPLNEWETYLLCLGYANTEHYSPYSDILGKLYDSNKAGTYDKTIAEGQLLLNTHPVCGSLYRELMYAHRRKGENEIADRYQRRAQRLYEAMIFTGDGTCEKPYITLTTTDEYALINYLGLYSIGQQALIHCNGAPTDELKYEDQYGAKGDLYFDVSLLFKSMRKSLQK